MLKKSGFSLIEVMFSLGLLAIIAFACLSEQIFIKKTINRVQLTFTECLNQHNDDEDKRTNFRSFV